MKATKVLCPKCGAELVIPQKQSIVKMSVAIGQDSNLGTVYLPMVDKQKKTKAQERIDKMREQGIDVSKFFAMNDIHGETTQVGVIVNGIISIIPDEDEIVEQIKAKGTILNSRLFKQHVLAQMFKMMVKREYNLSTCQYELHTDYYGAVDMSSYNDRLKQMGYEYQWEMLRDELYRQMKMIEHNDIKSFEEDHRWYNRELVISMLKDYRSQLDSILLTLRTFKHRGRKYVKLRKAEKMVRDKHSGYGYVYVDEIGRMFDYIDQMITSVNNRNTISELYHIVSKFVEEHVPLIVSPSYHQRNARLHKVHQCDEWQNAYKGYGAFFSMQNLILFHGCTFEDKDKDSSIVYLNQIAKDHRSEGWWLLGALKQLLRNNNFDIAAKQAEWARIKQSRVCR